MKAVSWSAMLFLGFLTGVAAADPKPYSSQINCEKKLNVNKDWDKVESDFTPSASNNELRITFQDTDMATTETTGSDGEWKVEGRCKGFVALNNNKPFKIRDFAFRVKDPEIGSADGRIELYVKGSSNIVAKGQKDNFEKNWKVSQSNLNKSPFAAQGESETLCNSDLKIQFDDLRAVVIRKQGEGDRAPTSVQLIEFVVRFDPC